MESKKNTKRNLLLALGAGALVLVFLFSSCVGKLMGSAVGAVGQAYTEDTPDGEYFSIIPIMGTIQASPDTPFGGTGYDHDALMSYIDRLMEDENNKGILLDVDSGGGTVFHSDEMYLKLMEYKETTGRPVTAYFEDTAASGAYYISCAADSITANRNCWTGSIGVIISYVNYKGLFDKLGLEEIIIASGDNKGMGSSAARLTDRQREIYQSLVDDSYDRFVGVVSKARKMREEDVRVLADGRVYSASQALENGLIDGIGSYDEAVENMRRLTGAEGYYKYFNSSASLLDYFLSKVSRSVPKSDMEVIREMAASGLSGKPLYMYVG